jgi:hypothetical protein
MPYITVVQRTPILTSPRGASVIYGLSNCRNAILYVPTACLLCRHRVRKVTCACMHLRMAPQRHVTYVRHVCRYVLQTVCSTYFYENTYYGSDEGEQWEHTWERWEHWETPAVNGG